MRAPFKMATGNAPAALLKICIVDVICASLLNIIRGVNLTEPISPISKVFHQFHLLCKIL